jgi:Protein of unknown function (DUF3800)
VRLRGLPTRSVERKLTRLHFLVYLLYLDDAGSPGNPAESYFVLGGICVYEAQAPWFTQELDRIASGIYPAEPASVEFHASTIFSRRSAPWNRLSQDDARGVIKNVLGVAATSYGSACLFACAIEKSSLEPGEDCVSAAFEDICQRFDFFLARKSKQGDRQRGLIILDRSTQETALQKLSHDFRRVGTKWGVVRNLADTPLFIDSRASRLVQVADHVAYSVFRRYNAGDAQYFDVIAARFDQADGVVHGLAHKHENQGTCVCPACLSRRLARSQAGDSV